jgi:O-antigen ligase
MAPTSTPQISSPFRRAAALLLYALLLVSPLFRGLVLPWHQTAQQLVVLVILALLLLAKTRSGQALWLPTPFDRPLAALLLLVGLSWLMSNSPQDSTEAIPVLLTALAIYYATVHLLQTREEEHTLVLVVVGGGLLLALLSLAHNSFPAFFPFWDYAGTGASPTGLSGPYRNHNHLAGALEMIIPLALALFLTRPRRGLVRFSLMLVVLLLVLAHLLALSRGGWFALAAALTLMTLLLLFRHDFAAKRLVLLVFTASAALLVLVLAGTDLFERALSLAEEETLTGGGGRLIVWRGTLEMIATHPFLGTGPGTYATIFPAFQPPGSVGRFFYAHNDYLQAIADLGLLFLPVLGWLLIALVRTTSTKLRSRSRQTRGMSLGALIGMVAILIHSVVDFNLHLPANATLFAVLAAILAAKRIRLRADSAHGEKNNPILRSGAPSRYL